MGEVSMRAELATDPKLAGLVAHLSGSVEFTRWMLAPARAAALLSGEAPPDPASLIAAPVLQHFALGVLIRVWDLGKCHSKDGFLPGLNFWGLNNLLGVPSFAQAMSAVGWARESEAPRGVTLPRFERYNGKPKAKKGRKPAADPLKIRPPQLASSLEFERAWDEWVKYRRGRSLTLTEATLQRQQAKLAAMGVGDAIKSINQSIEHGWQGLFPLKGDTNGRANTGRGGHQQPGRIEAAPGKYDKFKAPAQGPVPPPPRCTQQGLFPGQGEGDGPGAPEREAGDQAPL